MCFMGKGHVLISKMIFPTVAPEILKARKSWGRETRALPIYSSSWKSRKTSGWLAICAFVGTLPIGKSEDSVRDEGSSGGWSREGEAVVRRSGHHRGGE